MLLEQRWTKGSFSRPYIVQVTYHKLYNVLGQFSAILIRALQSNTHPWLRAGLPGSHKQKRPDQPMPNSTEKSQIYDKYTKVPLKHPNVLMKGNMYIIHKKNKAHSINELLENFGFAEE